MVAEKDNHRRPRIPALNTKFIFLVILSFVMLINDQKSNYLAIFRNSIAIAVYPLQSLVAMPSNLFVWINKNFSSREALTLENKILLNSQNINNTTLQRYQSLEQENSRLREILNAATRLEYKVEIARIISANINPYRHTIIINKGDKNGIHAGQVIVDADGVMGQILYTNFLTSEAILISDADHALPVQINRNGLRTIVLGNGSYTNLNAPYIPNNADIKIGDLLVTSGLGGKFPAGYPVGTINSIVRNPSEQFSNVTVKPIALLNQAQEVMLIRVE